MTISFSTDKQNEGKFLLRGLEAELVEGERVDVVTKGGKTITKTVGPRRAGPFPDGIVLHEQGGGGGTSKRAVSICPHCHLDANEAPRKVELSPVDDSELPF